MTTALERIHGADTRLTTAQRIAQQVIKAGTILGLSGIGVCGIGAISRIPSLQLVGAIITPGSLIIAAGASAASSEIGEKLDAAEILRLDASEQRAKGYRQGLEAGLEQGIEQSQAQLQGRFTEGFREGERTALITLQNQSDAAKNQALAQSQAQIDALQGELDQARVSLQSARDEVARLNASLKAKDREITQLSQLKKRIAAIKAKENEAADRIEQARQSELDLERLRTELVREHGSLYGDFEATKMIAQQSQNEVLRLENLIQELQQSHQQDLQDTQATAYQSGFNQALGESEQITAILQAKVAELEAKLGHRVRLENLERNTPSLKSVLSKREIQPTIICGSQGSGKALATLATLDILRGKGSVVPFILDVSEGGDPNSSWRKAGYPVTDSVPLFLSFLRALRAKIDSGDLPHRNSPDFASMPLIVPVIDEMMTAFTDCDKSTLEWIAETLTILETRGAKRKVVPIICSIDDQVQNLTINKVKMINSGRLRNFNFLALNQKLRTLADDAELKTNKPLSDYLDAMDGRYIAGILEFDARGSLWKPIKHPSHWLQMLVDKVPQTISQPPLSPCPDWLPAAVRAEYLAATANSPEQPPNKTNEQPNTPQGAGLRLLSVGAGDTPVLGANEPNERHERIKMLAGQGVSATAIAEQISGKKRGSSKAFLAAKNEVQSVLSEV